MLRRNGYANAGITEILGEAGLARGRSTGTSTPRTNSWWRCSPTTPSATARRLADHVDLAGSPLARVRAWIDEILALGDDPRHGEAARMFISPTMPGVFDAAGNEAIAELRAPLRAALAAGAAAGDFPDCDPDADAATIHAIVWRLFIDAINGRATMNREDARAHVERFALRALGARAGPDPLARGGARIASRPSSTSRRIRECTHLSSSTAAVTEDGATTR